MELSGTGIAALSELIADTDRQIEQLTERKARLESALAILNGAIEPPAIPLNSAAKSGKPRLSAKGRAAISKAAKRRWAKYRKGQRS